MVEGLTNILITRSRESARKSLIRLESLVERIIYFPTIVTEPIELSDEDFYLLKNFNDYDYLIFTSANGVKFFANIVGINKNSSDKKTTVAAVGVKTADAVEAFGMQVDIVPDTFSAEGMLEVLSGEKLNGKKILIPASENSRDVLKKGLEKKGATVDFVPIYRSVTRRVSRNDKDFEFIKKNKPEAFVFTSPSSVRGFLEIFSIENPAEYFGDSSVVAIGNVTEKYLLKLSVENVKTPETYTLEGIAELVESLIIPEGKNI